MELPQIFAEIAASIPARRGRLFEQYSTRTAADGTVRRTGPYYVLTRSVNGRTVSERVKAEDAPRVREEIERGARLAALFERIWEMSECAARQARDPKKKQGRTAPRRSGALRRPPAISAAPPSWPRPTRGAERGT